jgi:hypothetical protein
MDAVERCGGHSRCVGELHRFVSALNPQQVHVCKRRHREGRFRISVDSSIRRCLQRKVIKINRSLDAGNRALIGIEDVPVDPRAQ